MSEKQQAAKVSLEIERTINAPIEKVFDAWTTPEMFMEWWRASPEMEPSLAEIDLREGGTYRLGMKNPEKGTEHIVTGKYLKVERPLMIVFTWQWEDEGHALETETVVTIELFTKGDNSTGLTLTHERFPTEKARDSHEHGWNGCLNSLSEWIG